MADATPDSSTSITADASPDSSVDSSVAWVIDPSVRQSDGRNCDIDCGHGSVGNYIVITSNASLGNSNNKVIVRLGVYYYIYSKTIVKLFYYFTIFSQHWDMAAIATMAQVAIIPIMGKIRIGLRGNP